MLRAVLRPRPLGLLVLALALATGFAFLGQWQLERSKAVEGAPALERSRPLSAVLSPAETFRGGRDGQLVTATGRFGADLTGDPSAPATGAGGEVLLAGRDQGGRDGSWVVAPFQVADPETASGTVGGRDGDTAAGARAPVLPVVLGWVSPEVAARGVGALSPPPSGEVVLRGRLLVGEPPKMLGAGTDGSVLEALAPADLVNVWDARLYTGFVIASAPVAAAPLEQVTSAPPLRGTDWRAFSYALQWWLFAAFAVFFWWRVVRERFLPEAAAAQAQRAARDEERLAGLEAHRAGEHLDPAPDRPEPVEAR